MVVILRTFGTCVKLRDFRNPEEVADEEA